MNKVEKIEHALRTERDTLRKLGNMTAANVINTYIQNADVGSKERLFDLLMPEPKGDTVIQPNFEMTINWEQVANAWIGVVEGGYSPWLVEVSPAVDENSKLMENAAKGKGTCWYADADYWSKGGQMLVHYDDPETGEEGSGSAHMLVTQDKIVQGLRLMAEKSPGHFGDMISENDDANTHDVFAQYVILGEIIYG